jgi:hypothetical protein
METLPFTVASNSQTELSIIAKFNVASLIRLPSNFKGASI